MEDTEQEIVDEQPQRTIVDEAREERERLEKARDEAREERQRLERVRTDEVLSGTSVAGVGNNEPKEETPKEYKDRIMRGDLTDEERPRN